MDYKAARAKMVASQLEARDIVNPKVLEVMRKVPRHRFVDEGLWSQAYLDHPLPIGKGQTISQPYMVALMTQTLGLSGDEKVLEVGTGSGYQAAILAEMAREVYTIERCPELAERARLVLEGLGYENVTIKIGNGTIGWKEHAPYDRIIVTAGAPDVPRSLVEQLKDGGRMVIPIGGTYYQDLVVVEKKGEKTTREAICGCSFVPLVGKHGWKE
ncbi:MAG TPA: protein-L-isoaspartate(D-aspartate) O-methyltransferase [Candidatus Latescibacteria bacterium]|nr:protein-L-isoaspartate(D-aspartate) O-methyltransferase [Candidatus Latescibacterota bacterium]